MLPQLRWQIENKCFVCHIRSTQGLKVTSSIQLNHPINLKNEFSSSVYPHCEFRNPRRECAFVRRWSAEGWLQYNYSPRTSGALITFFRGRDWCKVGRLMKRGWGIWIGGKGGDEYNGYGGKEDWEIDGNKRGKVKGGGETQFGWAERGSETEWEQKKEETRLRRVKDVRVKLETDGGQVVVMQAKRAFCPKFLGPVKFFREEPTCNTVLRLTEVLL